MWIYWENAEKIAFGAGQWDVQIGGLYPDDGDWHHIATTRSSGTFYFFVDGFLIDTDTTSYHFNNEYNLIIGAYGQHGGDAEIPMTGNLDEVRISDTARWSSNFNPISAPSSILLLALGLRLTGLQQKKK